MYTENECKEIMKEIDKIQDKRSQNVLRKIVLEISEENARKYFLEQNTDSEQNTVTEQDIIKYITDRMLNLGISANLKGYYYIRDAVMMSVLEMERLDKITTRIYPDVAKKYGTTSSSVERAIRHAIEISFLKGNLEIFEEIFGYTIDSEKGKPTNSEFIALVSDHVRLKFNM